MRTRNPLAVLAALSLTTGMAGNAVADVTDTEPNNTCETAQVVGNLPLPVIVTGSLDTPPEVPDVDFYAFSGTAGDFLRVDLRGQSSGGGNLPDPFLGLFNSTCNLLNYSDDAGSLDSRLSFQVPDDGQFILAANSCCDFSFTGIGSSSGSYTMDIDTAPPPIGSITGRIVDALTGNPLPGGEPPYAFAELWSCVNGFCGTVVGFANTQFDGTFVFTHDFSGTRLEPGLYQVAARANDYGFNTVGPFDVAAGQHVDVGDLGLQPPRTVISAIRGCRNLPAEGGICRYSLSVRNNSNEALGARLWSNVQANGTGGTLGFSTFRANRVRKVELMPNESDRVFFNFSVPGDTPDGAYFCTDVFVSDNPDSFLDTINYAFLFCVSKIGNRFVLESEKQARARHGAGAFGKPVNRPRQ